MFIYNFICLPTEVGIQKRYMLCAETLRKHLQLGEDPNAILVAVFGLSLCFQ